MNIAHFNFKNVVTKNLYKKGIGIHSEQKQLSVTISRDNRK